LMHTDTRKNRAVSISTRLSFLAGSKSGGEDDSHHDAFL
jgi:hypothetical protein